MTSTGTTARATDTDALIKQWRASSRRAEQVAAEMAAKIDGGQMYAGEELSPAHELTDVYGVSASTVQRARRLLVAHGFMSLVDGRSYVANGSRE